MTGIITAPKVFSTSTSVFPHKLLSFKQYRVKLTYCIREIKHDVYGQRQTGNGRLLCHKSVKIISC